MDQNEVVAYLGKLIEQFENNEILLDEAELKVANEAVDMTTLEDLPRRVFVKTGHADYKLTLKFQTLAVLSK